MSSTPVLSRRQFVAGVSLTTLGLMTGAAQTASSSPPREVIGCIKPFQNLSFNDIAEIAAEIGWQGIECPVRKGGTIEPEAVQEELPRLVESLRKRNLKLPVIATDVADAKDPLAERVLRTASQLGVRRYRLKHLRYDLGKPIAPQLDAFKNQIRDLAQMNRELNIQGTIQNHSGSNYVGAPVWDLWELVRSLNPKRMAVYFDIGHATLEGGYSWPLNFKLVEPFLSVVSVKDFVWKKAGQAEWVPVGDGMIQKDFFSLLKKAAFQGPISQHFEYEVGSGKEMIAAMKKDLKVLRDWLG